MTEHELMILIDGILIGFNVALLLLVSFEMCAGRRSHKRIAAAEKHMADVRRKAGL